MKKNFFICNTYFQLIAAINMADRIFQQEKNTVVLTDTSDGMFELARNISEINVFDEVVCFSRLKFIKNIKNAFKYIISKEDDLEQFIEDNINIFFYNFDLFVASIVDINLKNGNRIELHRFEEGYVSYYSGEIESRVLRYANCAKRVFQPHLDIKKMVRDYYFYEAEFAQFSAQFNKIDAINKSDIRFKNKLNQAFGVKKDDFNIKEKYIFFEEPFSMLTNNKIDDVKLVKEIARIVGKDNLIVKMHPRIPDNRFERYGIKTYKAKGLPWELLQLNSDYREKVFLTVSSGCVIQGQMLFGEGNTTFLLYNCVEEIPSLVTEQYSKHIDNIVKKYNGNYMVPISLEEFTNKLEDLVNSDEEKM